MKHRGDLRRGELFWIDWSPGRGSEQSGVRPGLVVQADAPNRNENYPNTIVVAVSRAGRDVASHVVLEPTPDSGLKARSFAKCEQVQTVSKERVRERIGRVTTEQMARISIALKRMMELP